METATREAPTVSTVSSAVSSGEECISPHNLIRANKGHRVLAIKDFQDQDIEDVINRPAFCQIKRHENEALKFF